MEEKKICFVIMGFGKKKDPSSNRTIDLDETYKKIIRVAATACGYKCVRADEISESGIIDISMYALLMNAELVIADISTYNPNAIYELGVRHAVKPYSTIIIKEEDGNIPFDISHNRIISYKHLGSEISELEAKKCVRELRELITSITNSPKTDSPLYSLIPQINKPILSKEDYDSIIGDLRNKENTIYSLMENAKEMMVQKKFSEAASKWERLTKLVENEIFFTQQFALCTYKSENPNRLVALTNALSIINSIKQAADSETLGITGAINKNLWKVTGNNEYLNIAIESYKKGWNLYSDYYTGENYAHSLERKSLVETDADKKIYYKVEAKITRQKIIDIVLPTLEVDDPEEVMWKSASLSNCYRAIGNFAQAEFFEEQFLAQNPDGWEVDTFNNSKAELMN